MSCFIMHKRNGFSLVEMLITIAVIGVIAAIAVPSISSVRKNAQASKDKRNAQELASIFEAASAAGVNFSGGDEHAVVASIAAGVIADEGLMKGSYYGLKGLTEAERYRAVKYLDFKDGILIYTGDASDKSLDLAVRLEGSSGETIYEKVDVFKGSDKFRMSATFNADRFDSDTKLTSATVYAPGDDLGMFVTATKDSKIKATKKSDGAGGYKIELTGEGSVQDYKDAIKNVQLSMDNDQWGGPMSFGVTLKDTDGNTHSESFSIDTSYADAAPSGVKAEESDVVDFSGAVTGFSNSGEESINMRKLEEVNVGGPWPEKTQFVQFTTGGDLSGEQMVYEQGGYVRGYSLSILPDPETGVPTMYGTLYNHVEWPKGTTDRTAVVNLGEVEANKDYSVVMAHDAKNTDPSKNSFSVYVNGKKIGSVNNVMQQYDHPGSIGIGSMQGDTVDPRTGKYVRGNGREFAGKVHDVQILNELWSDEAAISVTQDQPAGG